MPVLLRCSCGKRVRVRDELSGRRVKCPRCQHRLPLLAQTAAEADRPSPSAEEAVELNGVSADPESFPPLPAEQKAHPDKSPSAPGVKWLVPGVFALGAALRLGGGWFLFHKGDAGRGQLQAWSQPDENDGFTPIPFKDMKLIPADAQGFLSIRVADWLKGKSGQTFAVHPMAQFYLTGLSRTLGMRFEDIDRAVLVWPAAKDGSPENKEHWLLLATREPLRNYNAIGPRVKSGDGATLIKHNGAAHPVFPIDETTYFHVAGERWLMIGSLPDITQFVESRSSAAAGPFHKALSLAESRHFVLAGQGSGLLLSILPADRVKEVESLSLTRFLLTCRDDEQMQVDSLLTFSDPAKAKSAGELVERWRVEAKKQIDAGLDNSRLFSTLATLLDKAQPQVVDDTVRIALATPMVLATWGPEALELITLAQPDPPKVDEKK